MSVAIDVGICFTSRAIPRVQEAVDALITAISSPFAVGSAGDLVLKPRVVDGTALVDANLPAAVSSDMLHSALEAVTGRQRREKQVSHIGLLLAGEYEPRPGFFGYMFDEAFVPGSSDPGELTPREGCAVFLSAIDRKRQGGDFIEEVIYTSVHELGHVFNQQHSSPQSFMATSADELKPFKTATCAFNPHEQTLLSKCSASRFIWPGGSAFGDLGDLGLGLAAPADAANAPNTLSLTVEFARDAFWPFEPVEMDLALSVTEGDSQWVPDYLDPGYEDFVIWIEEPSGERRRYRSPRHYCPHKGRVRISPDAAFRRDISLFGESGAYTFRKVGLHRVWAEFKLSPRSSLRSNVAEVFVKAPEESDAYEAAHYALSKMTTAQLLYYRRMTPQRAKFLPEVEGLCLAFPRQPSSAMTEYALGRSLESLVASMPEDSLPVMPLAKAAKQHLVRAAKSSVLGDHRRRHAEQALDRIRMLRL